MQIEKRLIACSILAIAIGIATIVPLEYMMAAQAQENAQANTGIPKVEPFSNVNVTYAYCNPNKISGNDTMTLYGAMIEVVVNFTLNPVALTNADAQIEYYQFAVSSDQGPIVNMTYYIAENPNNGIIIFIGPGIVALDNGLTTGPVPSNDQGITYDPWNRTFTTGLVSDYIFGTDANNLPQAVTDFRNAQTLYIDVSKVSTVTVNGNVTVTTPASNEVLQHIVLTKTDNGFVYGNYVYGTVPFPVEGPLTGPPPKTPNSSGETGNNTLSSP
jgi:hypothetical protein